jgi:hypothetical protein
MQQAPSLSDGVAHRFQIHVVWVDDECTIHDADTARGTRGQIERFRLRVITYGSAALSIMACSPGRQMG